MMVVYSDANNWLNYSKNEKYFIKIVEKIKTHTLYVEYFSSENRAVYEIMLKNMVQPKRPQTTI